MFWGVSVQDAVPPGNGITAMPAYMVYFFFFFFLSFLSFFFPFFLLTFFFTSFDLQLFFLDSSFFFLSFLSFFLPIAVLLLLGFHERFDGTHHDSGYVPLTYTHHYHSMNRCQEKAFFPTSEMGKQYRSKPECRHNKVHRGSCGSVRLTDQ